MEDSVREYLTRIGKAGGRKGGLIRAANLTPERRSEIARNAVTARWAKSKKKRGGKKAPKP